jgi:hypothetical protein
VTTRRFLLSAGLSVIAASFLAPAPAYVLGATAITEVFGDGQRLVGVAIEYGRPVDPTTLDPALYAVEGRTVTRLRPLGAGASRSGHRRMLRHGRAVARRQGGAALPPRPRRRNPALAGGGHHQREAARRNSMNLNTSRTG